MSFGYTKWSAAEAEATKRKEATLRAKLEVSQRLAQVVAHYEKLRRSKKSDESARLEEMAKLLNAAIQPPTSSAGAQGPAVFAAYTEFKDRPMLSMAIELLTLEQSPKGRDAALILYRWTLKVASGEFDGKSVDTIKDAFQALRTNEYWHLPRNEA